MKHSLYYSNTGSKREYEIAQAIAELYKAYEARHPGLVLIRVEPLVDTLRDEPRFQELLRRFEPVP